MCLDQRFLLYIFSLAKSADLWLVIDSKIVESSIGRCVIVARMGPGRQLAEKAGDEVFLSHRAAHHKVVSH
jgi:hypothetical protein